MRPIRHRHYRPLNLFKIPLSLSLLLPIPVSNPRLFSLSSLKFSSSVLSESEPSIESFSSRMAQKTEKEETEFKVPETITLCVNNCGVIGNPGTNNMCQKCFTASTTTTTSATPTTSSSTMISSASSSSSSSNLVAGIATPMQFSAERSPRSRRLRSPDRPKASSSLMRQNSTADRPKSEDSTQTEVKRSVNRCSGCRRKVGLTGFRCRCGELFCSEHRYSDRHDCSYDYKAAGREAIARENPVVKAAKIVRV